MLFRSFTLLALFAGLTVPVGESCCAQSGDARRVEYFEEHVRPLLAEKCFNCHGVKKQQAGLRLDSRMAMLKGGENGPVLVPGDPSASRIVQVLEYSDDDVQMPPQDKLDEAAISLLTAWVKSGAVFPESASQPETDSNAWRKHWAFQPVRPVTVPTGSNDVWIRTNIDRFVSARLTANGLRPNDIASPRTQIRRLYYDLIGLPPTFEQIARFQQNPTDEEFNDIVDELLSSKHFGERWGRYWLDVARFADTRGYVFTKKRVYEEAHLYRDWVLNALNNDMPFDRFLIHQLAADFLAPQDAGQLAAMGYLTLGRRFLNNPHDIIDDRIDVVTRGMMGLTVTCARCHDHKYDPIPTADYYSLYGVFASSDEPANAPSTLRLIDRPKPREPVVFLRGNPAKRGKRIPRRFLSALSEGELKPFQNGSGRLELAKAIASRDNPLTARVFVNRVWSHLFGRGLVTTNSDFGLRSDPPSHPLLLDDLADGFMSHGWSVKRLIRRIVVSSVYRQGSSVSAEVAQNDPENRLLSHTNRRRLDFESHRDSLLFVGGQLDQSFGGVSVKLTEKPFPRRRTCYAFIDRQNLPGLFRAFDFASPDTHSPGRHETTVPQQALFQLNNQFVHEMSSDLASRSQPEGADNQDRIQRLHRLAFGRDATPEEIEIGLAFVDVGDDSDAQPIWQYGFGKIAATAVVAGQTTQQVIGFTPFTHFTGSAWQAGTKLPDPQFGWVNLSATGGHPGNPNFMAIRRWVAPAAGKIAITGQLKNETKQGDGVRARVVSSRHGTLADWTASNSSASTVVIPFEVQPGDTVDFVVDCRTSENSDSYHWNLKLRIVDSDSRRRSWDSSEDFAGQQLTIWDQYAQVLLLSNEFVFID
jgi:hypothetical protein